MQISKGWTCKLNLHKIDRCRQIIYQNRHCGKKHVRVFGQLFIQFLMAEKNIFTLLQNIFSFLMYMFWIVLSGLSWEPEMIKKKQTSE